MKYDTNKKMTKFAERTLKEFAKILFWTLKTKPLEKITINELCEKANYPRATFYNYIDDINDLLNYCWQRIASDMVVDNYDSLTPEKRPYILFERCYDYLNEYRDNIEKIMTHNTNDGRFAESLRKYIRQQIYTILVTCPPSKKYQLSYDQMSEHYANTIHMILDWSFIRKNQMDKEEAMEALRYLIGGIQ